MVTKTCQPGSIYLQTWIRSPTQMPLDIQTTNFSTPDWGPRFRGLEAATVRCLPLWRGAHCHHTQTHVFRTGHLPANPARGSGVWEACVFIMLDVKAVDRMWKFLETPKFAILRNQTYVWISEAWRISLGSVLHSRQFAVSGFENRI